MFPKFIVLIFDEIVHNLVNFLEMLTLVNIDIDSKFGKLVFVPSKPSCILVHGHV